MPPHGVQNHGRCLVSFILTLVFRQTTRATANHLFHPRQPIHSPAASMCTPFHRVFDQQFSTRRVHLHLQGKFLHLSSRLSSTFCTTCSQSQHILSISDGGSKLPVHSPNAKGWGLNPPRYPPELGWDQPQGYPLLCLDMYALHAVPLPQQPAHPPR